MEIIKAYATKNLCYIKAEKMIPQGIIVHSTGSNNPMLKRYVDAPDKVGINKYGNHWNREKPDGRMVCVHAFIGYDNENKIKIAEILPLDICCWGVGTGKYGSYNYDPAYIQFEICEDTLENKAYYKNVFNVAAEYCAYLCSTYNLPVENIIGHNEAYQRGYGSNHGDPEHWMKKHGETMCDFRNKVNKLLHNTKTNIKTTVEKPNTYAHLVKVIANSLNIRKGPGINNEIIGQINDKGVYTIVEEKNGAGATLWGKLKSGIGWISLDHVKKI